MDAILPAGFPGGLVLPTNKNLSNAEDSILVPLPERLTLPLQQHIGLPAKPIVHVGEHVLKGQLIAVADGHVSVPLHASTSGRIADIGDHLVPRPFLHKAPCIVIEADGDDRWYDIQSTEHYDQVAPGKLQQIIQNCGIVGLGGAGFPAHVKLHEGMVNAVDTLIINGVECEPYITCDDRLIREKARYVVAGTGMIAHAVQAKHSIIAIEGDMLEAEQALRAELKGEAELIRVETRYPAGGEKQLIETLTGKRVPDSGLAIHIGIVMHNVATAAAVFRAVTRGEPTVSRYVTVTGDVEHPRNVQALLGTPIADCFRLCDSSPPEDHQLIVGGPMMGVQVNELNVPVTKTVNCLLALSDKQVNAFKRMEPEQPCIHCGHCVQVCPARLMPQELHRLTRLGQLNQAREQGLFDCIECGCCSYVCPSHLPLVSEYRQAKALISEEERKHKGADHARRRFLKKNSRSAERTQQDIDHLATDADAAERRSVVQQAIDRDRQRRAPASGPSNGTDDNGTGD